MNSMERVLAALKGEMADKRPFTLTLSLYGAKLTDCPLTEYYTNPKRYLEGQIAVHNQIRPDILFTPFALALEAQAFGSDIVFLSKQPPNVKKPILRNLNELSLLKVPSIENSAGLSYLLDSAKLLTTHFKQDVPVCGVLTSPLDLPAILMGVDNWLELLLFQTDKAKEVAELISHHFVEMANRMFENGVAFIALPMMFSNPQILLDKIVVEFIVPTLSTIFSKVKGPIVFHHGGNPIASYLPLYRSLPGIAGFVLDPKDDFEQARVQVGKERLLLGNINGPTLGKISPSLAIEKAKLILEKGKNDRHFIFASSGADVGWDTPLETLVAIQILMESYGNESD